MHVQTVRTAFSWLVGGLVAFQSASGSEEIAIGMSTALSGPAADLGTNMRAGVMSAFFEANANVDVGGRVLRLIALDDGYEPALTVPNMRRLIDTDGVLAIVGNVGTPTAVAAIPIANESRTPFFGAFTGAGILRKSPPDRYVINYRASYAEETAAMVDALILHGGLKPEEVGVFTQRDAYGDAGFVGAVTALERHGLTDRDTIAHGRYERNTMAVENGLAELILADPVPRAVIMVGAYGPCAKAIRLGRESGLEAIFLNVSFVGSASLAEALGDAGEGVIITQVVPHIEADLPVVKAHAAALEAWAPGTAPTFGSLEGYIAGRILVKAMSGIPGTIDRESIVVGLESLGAFDIGLGVSLELSAEEHQACHAVWPTIIRAGRVVEFEWSEMATEN